MQDTCPVSALYLVTWNDAHQGNIQCLEKIFSKPSDLSGLQVTFTQIVQANIANQFAPEVIFCSQISFFVSRKK